MHDRTQVVSPEEEYAEEEEENPIYSEHQIGQMILRVRSRAAQTKTKEGKWKETGYKEILTTDVSTAFLDSGSLAVLRNLEELLAMIMSFGQAHKIDMRESYNFIADYHNALAVSSKATGEGSRVAKSQYVEQKFAGKYWDERRKQSRLEKLLERAMGSRRGEW